MLNPEVKRLLNEQINKEFFSAYLYLDMANYYVDKNLAGFENWFYVQPRRNGTTLCCFANISLTTVRATFTEIAAPTLNMITEPPC